VSVARSQLSDEQIGDLGFFDSCGTTQHTFMCQQQGCPLYGKISGYKPTLHWVPQNTGCEAWRKLVASVQRCARSRAARFCITEELTSGEMLQITTLPSSIGDCTDLEHLQLYGTNITRLPPEIGNLTSLQSFTPYTTHCLHWYPYELVHCGNLHDSTVSTRANYKHRSFEFPCLGRERYPLEALDPSIWRDYLASPSAPIRPCSVCRTPFEDYGHYRVWVSRVVATVRWVPRSCHLVAGRPAFTRQCMFGTVSGHRRI